MSTQLDLFAQRHSPTSVAAAESMAESAPTLRAKVLAYLRESGPATDEQIQEALGLGGNCERPRRRELEQAGKVVDSGEKALTNSGRSAVLWKAV